MTVWHEPKKDPSGWIFPPHDGGRVAVVFTGEDVREAPFQGCFLRYEGDLPVPHGLAWKVEPEGWFELYPREPFLASSMEEAQERFTPLLPGLEDGSADDQYERRPYEPPVRPTRIEEIEHVTHRARAVIVKHPAAHYEVGYLVYAPFGKYIPAETPSICEEYEWEWGVTWTTDEGGQDLRTLAEDLESARQVAAAELEAIVRQDPEIRRR